MVTVKILVTMNSELLMDWTAAWKQSMIQVAIIVHVIWMAPEDHQVIIKSFLRLFHIKVSILEYCDNLMIGDDICDDGCNIGFFNFDNGDCCLPKMVNLKCNECACNNDTQVQLLSYCLKPMIGDFKCQDACNTQKNNFDAFDCCFDQIDSTFCSDCICHLDNHRHESTSHCYLGMIGDGFCHDECNTVANAYDNGDCCLPTVHLHPFLRCDICFCHLSEQFHSIVYGTCTIYEIGNGQCSDACNIEPYQYDGGDCCIALIFPNCIECICHQDNSAHPQALCSGSEKVKIGDGICNPECNHLATEFDGFDCCLDYIDDQFCDCGMFGRGSSVCTACKCKVDGNFHPPCTRLGFS